MFPRGFLACLTTRSRGNPFLRAVARQKFLPPSSLALSRFFAARQTLAKTGALRQRQLAASSAGRASLPLPPGDKIRAAHSPRGGSHTLCAKFPWLCPGRTHMSSDRDFFVCPCGWMNVPNVWNVWNVLNGRNDSGSKPGKRSHRSKRSCQTKRSKRSKRSYRSKRSGAGVRGSGR